MDERKQITVRSVKKTTYERLRNVAMTCHVPLGILLDEAVEMWWDQLPEAENG